MNQPLTQNTEAASFKIEGNIPKFVLVFLESAFNKAFRVEMDETERDSYDPKEIPELVEAAEKTTPGEAIFLDRDLRGMTQAELAKMLGVAVTVVSDMENNRRPVSRKMALRLGKVFGTDPASFFDFGG